MFITNNINNLFNIIKTIINDGGSYKLQFEDYLENGKALRVIGHYNNEVIKKYINNNNLNDVIYGGYFYGFDDIEFSIIIYLQIEDEQYLSFNLLEEVWCNNEYLKTIDLSQCDLSNNFKLSSFINDFISIN